MRGCKLLLPVFLACLTLPAMASDALSPCLALAGQDPDRAAADATAWLRRAPGNRDARLCLATAAFHANDFAAAAQQFNELAQRTRPDAQAAIYFGKAAWAAMRNNDNPAAERAFYQAIKRDPDNLHYRQDYAMTMMAMERYWDAVRQLTGVLARDKSAVEALALRGECWLKLGQQSRARQDAAAALVLQPEHTLARAIMQKLPLAQNPPPPVPSSP